MKSTAYGLTFDLGFPKANERVRGAYVKRFALYLIRWQLSTPILAPVVAIIKHSPTPFGSPQDWLAASVANFIGGCIFFNIDKYLFRGEIRRSADG